MKKILSVVLCVMLVLLVAFTTIGCGVENNSSDANTTPNVSVLGEGQTVFELTVTDREDKETEYEIHTDKTTVGDALFELEMVDNKDGMVINVNGVTADYNVDGKYWAFYIDGEYAMTGVYDTDIKEGSVYSLKVE